MAIRTSTYCQDDLGDGGTRERISLTSDPSRTVRTRGERESPRRQLRIQCRSLYRQTVTSAGTPAGRPAFETVDTDRVSEFTELFPDPDCDVLASPLEEIRCDVNNDIPIAPNIGMQVSIDGKAVKDLFAYRAQSQPGGFRWVIPEDGVFTVFGFDPGPRFPTVTDGHWILLRPLSRAAHGQLQCGL